MSDLHRAVVVSALFAAGCREPDASEVVRATALPILDGAVDDATSAVVFVMPAICSGTVIAPNLVLTAQHCVAPLTGAADAELDGCYPSVFGPPIAPGGVSVYTGNPAGGAERTRHQVLEIVLPPYTTPANQICGNDVALLILQAPIPAPEVTPINPRVDVPVVAGEPYSALGFGKIDPDLPVDTDQAVRYRRDGLEAECSGTACSSLPGYVVASEWRGDGATCGGDSGGPAIDGIGRVIGVDSRNNGCGTYSLYGGVEPHRAWISETAIRAAEVGGYEAPLWSLGWPSDPAYSSPVGATCEAPGDCPSGLCLDEVCTRRCGDATPCPDGYVCGEGGLCEKVAVVPPDAPEPDDAEEAENAGDGCSFAAPSSGRSGSLPTPFAPLAGLLLLRGRRRNRQPAAQAWDAASVTLRSPRCPQGRPRTPA